MAKRKVAKVKVTNPLDGIADKLDAITNPVADKKVKKVKKSPLQTRLESVLQPMVAEEAFGCQQGSVIKLVEAITGLKLDLGKADGVNEHGYRKYEVVVPTGNPNSHCYKVNEPCMIVHTDTALRADGRLGDHLPRRSHQVMRAATRDEIMWFVNSLPLPALQSQVAGVLLEK